MSEKMKVAIFVEPGRIVLDEMPIPDIGPLDALIRITTTTIGGTDMHVLKGEYPVARGPTVGHEPVGVMERLGSAVTGFSEGERVIAGAITPYGYSHATLSGCGRNAARALRTSSFQTTRTSIRTRKLPGSLFRPPPGGAVRAALRALVRQEDYRDDYAASAVPHFCSAGPATLGLTMKNF